MSVQFAADRPVTGTSNALIVERLRRIPAHELETILYSRTSTEATPGCLLWAGRMSVTVAGVNVSAREGMLWLAGHAPADATFAACGQAVCVNPDHVFPVDPVLLGERLRMLDPGEHARVGQAAAMYADVALEKPAVPCRPVWLKNRPLLAAEQAAICAVLNLVASSPRAMRGAVAALADKYGTFAAVIRRLYERLVTDPASTSGNGNAAKPSRGCLGESPNNRPRRRNRGPFGGAV